MIQPTSSLVLALALGATLSSPASAQSAPPAAATTSNSASSVPSPSDMRSEMIINGNVSTRKNIDVVFTDQAVPKTFARDNIDNVTGFHWFVSKHFALQTDHDEREARQALELLEMAYPHWIDYVGDEPEDMHDTRIAMVYATRWQKIRTSVTEYGFTTSPVKNGEQMFFNSAAYSHDGGMLYLLLHEGFHAYCDAFRGSYGSGWFGEGAAQDSASYVLKPDFSQVSVFTFDPGPGNRFQPSLDKWKKKAPSVDGFTRWGPNYNPGATIQHFFKDEPLRNQYWKVWAKEVHSARWRGRNPGAGSSDRSDKLLYSLFGGKKNFKRQWEQWLKTSNPATRATGWWHREGNEVNLRGEAGHVRYQLALGEEAKSDATVLDFFSPAPSRLVGHVKRGGKEPSVGALINIKGQGRTGIALGVEKTELVKVLIDRGQHLVVDASALKGQTVTVPLPGGFVAAPTGDKPVTVGMNVKVSGNSLEVTLRTEPNGVFKHTFKLKSSVASKIRKRPVGLAADGFSKDTLVAYFDDGRPTHDYYLKDAPANRWRNPGDDAFGRVVEAEWYLGKATPKSIKEARKALHAAADKDAQTQQTALNSFEKTVSQLASEVASNQTQGGRWGLEALSGVRFYGTWKPDASPVGSSSNVVTIAGVVENPSSLPISGTINFTASDAAAVQGTVGSHPVTVAPRSKVFVTHTFTRAPGAPSSSFTVNLAADLRWANQSVKVSSSIIDAPWPGLRLNVDPVVATPSANEAVVNLNLTGDDGNSTYSEIRVEAFPAEAVVNPVITLLEPIPASKQTDLQAKFKFKGQQVPLEVRVTGFFNMDGERIRLSGTAATR